MSAFVQTDNTPVLVRGALRPRPTALVMGALALVLASFYAVAIVATEGQPMLLVPIVGAVVGLLVITRPVTGVYLLFGAALLFEQADVPGIAPLTDQSHVWQRLDAYSSIPLPLSIADLLIVLTLATLLVHRVIGRHAPLRLGPFGWAVIGYGAVFVVGMAFGIARGGPWNLNASLAEARAPLHMCLLYVLTANLFRSRTQMTVLVWLLTALVGVKALQAIWGYAEGLSQAYALEAVTVHEDVVFFDLAI